MLREIKREELIKQIGKDVIIVSLMGGDSAHTGRDPGRIKDPGR